MRPRLFRPLVYVLLCGPLLAGLLAAPCAAREFTEAFEGSETTWDVVRDKAATRLLAQRRGRYIFHQGGSAENIEIETFAPMAAVRLEHPLPPSLLIDELQLAVWLRSNRDGASLAIRVVFPFQKDSRTGDSVSVLLEGDRYTKPGTWQRLECRDLLKQLHKKLPQLRRQLMTDGDVARKDVDRRSAFVDRAVIKLDAERGTAEYFIDDLKLGPVVSPAHETPVVQTGLAEPTREAPDVELRLDHLLYQGRPFFPRIVAYHGEQVRDLAAMRLNVVWVPSYQDRPLLNDLKQHGLQAMATPPRPISSAGELLEENAASLAPFGADTAPILFWYLGTRIPADARRELAAWSEQVRNADRQRKRPLMADVATEEKTFSRQISMLGVSRHVLHTNFTPKMYRDWLIERRNTALPGSFLWTWTQTEPVLSTSESRRAAQASPIVVEPEQLRLQVYAALAAGYRGIGFWTHTSLDAGQPGGLERKLALAQLNMELELLEPLLATGTVQTSTPFTAKLPPGPGTNQLSLGFGVAATSTARRDALLKERDNRLLREAQLPRELEAAVIRTEYGYLVLPIWYGEEANFVPGQMAANDASIVVTGVDETAAAWEISTTGLRSISTENRKRVAGGIQITLSQFDMTSAIIFSSDRTLVERLRQKMESLRARSAEVCLELAFAKYERVLAVDRRLQELGVGQLDAVPIMARARALLDDSRAVLQRQQFHESRLQSANALQLVRILQNAYWRDAIRNLSDPVSSPHTLCFQTLPDHWEMISQFGRSPAPVDGNLLRSGDFEDYDTMVAEGWKHEQTKVDGVRAAAELYPRPHGGTYCLRLVAVAATGQDPPAFVRERLVTVVSPPVTVRKGQIVYIGGWVQVVSPIQGNLDGAMFYDSLSGPAGALRFRAQTGWQHFQVLREVHESGDLNVTLTLNGLGEIHFDDLQIIPHDDGTLTQPSDLIKAQPAGSTGRASPLDLLRRLPGFGGKPAAKPATQRQGSSNKQ